MPPLSSLQRGRRFPMTVSGRFLAGLVLLMVLGSPWDVIYAQPTEYEVKAAFLNNFIKFTEWPASTLAEDDTLLIGILGDGPMEEELARIIDRRSGQGRPVRLRRVSEPADAAECHVLFIHNAAQRRFREMASELKNRPVLTIGETAGFLRSGGVINLFIRNSRVQFEVNAGAGERAGLILRSQLLRLGAASGDKASNEN